MNPCFFCALFMRVSLSASHATCDPLWALDCCYTSHTPLIHRCHPLPIWNTGFASYTVKFRNTCRTTVGVNKWISTQRSRGQSNSLIAKSKPRCFGIALACKPSPPKGLKMLLAETPVRFTVRSPPPSAPKEAQRHRPKRQARWPRSDGLLDNVEALLPACTEA